MSKEVVKAQSAELAPWAESEETTIKEKYGKGLTGVEWNIFRSMAVKTGLNPMFGEIYATKYGSGPASIFVGKNGYLRRASEHPAYDGHKVELVADSDGRPLGAVATVWRKDRGHPITVEVDMDEYDLKQSVWKSKPKTMIKKVALSQALREAFPGEFNGTYDESEKWETKEVQATVVEDYGAKMQAEITKPTQMSKQDMIDWKSNLEAAGVWAHVESDPELDKLRETKDPSLAQAIGERAMAKQTEVEETYTPSTDEDF